MRSLEVQAFAFNLEANIVELHELLLEHRWLPEPYKAFYVRDPKLRHIHKASVRDRVLYQALFRALYPVFDPLFIHDSYSCRREKGTHRGVLQLERYLRKATKNHSQIAYALKCDVRKFFDRISHTVLYELLTRRIDDADTHLLISRILSSFEVAPGRGLPLGNVTSQLFANVYLNELDQFAKHKLKAKYYLRYCDDFVIIDLDSALLASYIPQFKEFLAEHLSLELHPTKISLRKVSQGVDFLGYIVLPHYRVVRPSTRRRMFRKLESAASDTLAPERLEAAANSYLGVVSHAKGYGLRKRILEITKREG